MPSKPAFLAMTAASACQTTNSFISSTVRARGISKWVNLRGTAEGPTASWPSIVARGAEVPRCMIWAKTLAPPSWMASVMVRRVGTYFSSVSRGTLWAWRTLSHCMLAKTMRPTPPSALVR